ncbi:hypothetical protein ACL598_16975 [Bordetella bronchialis]|uniref:hypothetical protein n=1 Tax=Bordetella bronchialis TaxID=463025 RepID=UPI003D05A570
MNGLFLVIVFPNSNRRAGRVRDCIRYRVRGDELVAFLANPWNRNHAVIRIQ